MSDEMRTFRVDVEIENPSQRGSKRRLTSVLVDTGVELSWLPSEVLESLGIERPPMMSCSENLAISSCSAPAPWKDSIIAWTRSAEN